MTQALAVLAIGGLDPTGQAGLAADLRAGLGLGILVAPIAAALTVQGSRGVSRVEGVDPGLLAEQIRAALNSLPVAAVKLGLIPTAAALEAVLNSLPPSLPVVMDPVLSATRGGSLVAHGYVEALRLSLGRVSLLTPNLPEAAAILGQAEAKDQAGMELSAEALLKLGARSVLLKGGHLGGPQSPDLLAEPDSLAWLQGKRVDTPNTRGTGCTLATLIACNLAQGKPLTVACGAAKAALSSLLKRGSALAWPQGPGPLLPEPTA